jgi:hypothetical protein
MMIMGTQFNFSEVKRLSGGNTPNKNKSVLELKYGKNEN